MDANGYLVFLVVGAVLVFADGQLIYRNGRGYLDEAYGAQAESARSMNRLVAVLFHLVVLGVLLLVSTIGVNSGDPTRDLLIRLGVWLLVLAAAHAATMRLLARARERQLQARLTDEIVEEHEERRHPGTVVTPVPEQGRPPSVTPSLEDRGPYRS